jgi:transcriptional regulator with XRE-family HTH domain
VEALRNLIEEWMRVHAASQADLAARSGVPQNVVSRWLNRQVDDASPKNLKRIAPTLGLTYEELLRKMGELPSDEAISAGRALHPRLAAFMDAVEAAFHSMSDQEWQIREEAGRALFRVEDTRTLPPERHRRRVTDDPEKFGRPKNDGVQQPLMRRVYQSQSLAAQVVRYGFQPAVS